MTKVRFYILTFVGKLITPIYKGKIAQEEIVKGYWSQNF